MYGTCIDETRNIAALLQIIPEQQTLVLEFPFFSSLSTTITTPEVTTKIMGGKK